MINGLNNIIFEQALQFFLQSNDFNGLPCRNLQGDASEIKSAIIELIADERLVINFGDRHPNPHILALEPEPPQEQIEKIKLSSIEYACLYPTRKELAKIIPKTELAERPFTRLLRLGEPHLTFKYFDLNIMELYRNDPRYKYDVDEISGNIWIKSDYYETNDIRQEDKTYLRSFGFGYSKDLKIRVVVAITRYLSDLTPEHQNIWRAKEIIGDYFPHPDYERMLFGAFPEGISIFDAFLAEMSIINELAKLLGRKSFFKKEYSGDNRPREFSFLLRSTLKEYRNFAHLLDKMISENINIEFFQNDIEFEREIKHSGGKISYQKKNSISLLEEWLNKFYEPQDPKYINEMIATFKKIRKDRQPGAHVIENDLYDMQYFSSQRELINNAYDALHILRLVLTNHPLASGFSPPEWFEKGKIWSY
jgi:hypothetical protein